MVANRSAHANLGFQAVPTQQHVEFHVQAHAEHAEFQTQSTIISSCTSLSYIVHRGSVGVGWVCGWDGKLLEGFLI